MMNGKFPLQKIAFGSSTRLNRKANRVHQFGRHAVIAAANWCFEDPHHSDGNTNGEPKETGKQGSWKVWPLQNSNKHSGSYPPRSKLARPICWFWKRILENSQPHTDGFGSPRKHKTRSSWRNTSPRSWCKEQITIHCHSNCSEGFGLWTRWVRGKGGNECGDYFCIEIHDAGWDQVWHGGDGAAFYRKIDDGHGRDQRRVGCGKGGAPTTWRTVESPWTTKSELLLLVALWRNRWLMLRLWFKKWWLELGGTKVSTWLM